MSALLTASCTQSPSSSSLSSSPFPFLSVSAMSSSPVAQQWPLYSQLQTAIQFNDLQAAECLLKRGLDSDYRFGASRTPALCLSVKSGNYDLVRLLIDHGCSVNQADEANGQSALHWACSFIKVEIARLLISHRASVDACNLYGSAPLHLAVMNSSLELVRLLVESGASIEKRDSQNQTALLLACAMNSLPIAQYLLSVGANVNAVDKAGNTPLLLALDSGLSINTQLVKMLLTAGANPNQGNQLNGSLPLLVTIRRSSDHIADGALTVQELIDHHCNIHAHEYQPPYYGESALNLSINRSQDAITEKLIRSGADVDEKSINGQRPFVRLVKEGKTELAKLALANSTTRSLHSDLMAIEEERSSVANSDPELFAYLFSEGSFFPRLKHLSRVKIRAWLGSSADRVIPKLQLPYSLRKYLLLGEL